MRLLSTDLIKKACAVFNRIMSDRADYGRTDVYIKVDGKRSKYGIGKQYAGFPFSESQFFNLLLDEFLENGELCYDRVDDTKEGKLTFHLKTVF